MRRCNIAAQFVADRFVYLRLFLIGLMPLGLDEADARLFHVALGEVGIGKQGCQPPSLSRRQAVAVPFAQAFGEAPSQANLVTLQVRLDAVEFRVDCVRGRLDWAVASRRQDGETGVEAHGRLSGKGVVEAAADLRMLLK